MINNSKQKIKHREAVYYWPHLFSASLPPKLKENINPRLNNRLGQANLNLWRAMNIYDDLLDGDSNSHKLPRANYYYRSFLETYYRLNLSTDFYLLFKHTLNNLDKFNNHEVRERLIIDKNKNILNKQKLSTDHNPSTLSQKSLALGLAPAAILASLGPQVYKKFNPPTQKFFRYALAAKQLADDLLDWSHDLKKGQPSFAVITLLRVAKRKKIKLNLEAEEVLCRLFVIDVIPIISQQLKTLCQRARQAAIAAGWPHSGHLLNEIIKPLEIKLTATTKLRYKWRLKLKTML